MSARIQVAINAHEQEDSFKIRHRVYCEEQGWERTAADQTESDHYDAHATHVVLRDERSVALGTVRLIPASTAALFVVLPIERCFGLSLSKIFPEQTLPDRRRIAEVSRLAVLPEYRRMLNLPEPTTKDAFPAAMRFCAVQLFLGALAAAHKQGAHSLVMLMEPKLFRYLRALGFRHSYAGQSVDHHGLRIPIIAHIDGVMQSLPPALASEFKRIAG